MQYYNQRITINKTDYLIQEVLGEGTFGIVLKGLNQQINQTVAIKEQKIINQNELKMLNEMKQKDFKNLIKILEVEQINGMYYVVMEYCKESLYNRIQSKGTIKPDDIRFIMKEIGNGLKEIHDLGFAHRDIKPENILIFQKKDLSGKIQEIYKICDFGTIKKVDVLQTQEVGTAYYYAPEQLNNMGQYTQKVDIWAFGALIYELMTNTPMFNGQSEEEIKRKILSITQGDIDSTINNNLRLDRKIKTLLLNMLQKDPNKRYDIYKLTQDLRGQSQNVTKVQVFNQRSTQPSQVQEKQPNDNLPIPSNYFKQQIPQFTNQINLPNPLIFKQQQELQLQKKQGSDFNDDSKFERSKQINNVQKSTQNGFSLTVKNPLFQPKPFSSPNEDIGKSLQINQFQDKKSQEVEQNINFSQPLDQFPPKQCVAQIQFKPPINFQQSNIKKCASTSSQDQTQQQNLEQKNNQLQKQFQLSFSKDNTNFNQISKKSTSMPPFVQQQFQPKLIVGQTQINYFNKGQTINQQSF